MIQSLLRLHLGISFNEDDILAEVRRIADRSGKRPEDVRKELVDRGDLQNLEHSVVLGRITDKVISQATLI